MSLHEHLEPGIYIDDDGENIWRKSFGPQGLWTVNGQPWKPFPKSLTTLRPIANTPAPDMPKVILDTLDKAQTVLDALDGVIEQYNSVSIADLYDLVGISGRFTDQKWGWTDLRKVTINRVREGYLIDLPKPESLSKR